MKRVLVQFKFPGMPAKKYEQAWDEIRAAGKANIPGLIFHVGSAVGDDFVVVDVWESAEAFAKFGEILGPIMAKVGVPQVQPTITPVNYIHTNEKQMAF